MLAACSGKSPTTTFDSVIDHPAKESGIDTVVILTMENRSFDHMLGWLATDAEYLDLARRRNGPNARVDGRQDLRYRDPRGRSFPTSLLTTNGLEADPWRGCAHPIPGHGWNSGRAQLRSGFLGTGTGNDEYAIGYFDGDDVPFTRELARRFTVFDHWHAPLMAGTFPNRQYLHSGTSDGRKEDPIPLRVGIFDGPTIWDRLTAARVPARSYYVDLPIIMLWGRRMDRYRSVRRVGRVLRPRATAGGSRRPALARPGERLRPDRVPGTGDRRVPSIPADRRRAHAQRPHLGAAVPRVAVPRRTGTGAGRREPLVAHATRPPCAQPRERARRGALGSGPRVRRRPPAGRGWATVRVPAVGNRAAATGSAAGTSSEWEADQELRALTRPVVPDVSAAPWLLP